MNYGTKQGHFLGYWKVILVHIRRWSHGTFQDDNNIFHKMKNDLATGTWQDDIWCPINIILLCTSDESIRHKSNVSHCSTPSWHINVTAGLGAISLPWLLPVQSPCFNNRSTYVTRRQVPPPLPSLLSLVISDAADCTITQARMHTNSPDMPLLSPSLTDAFTWMGHDDPSMQARWGSTVLTEEQDHLQLKVQQTAAWILPPPCRHHQRGCAAQWHWCLDLVPPSDSKGAAPTAICPFPATTGCKWNNPKQEGTTLCLLLPLPQLMHLLTLAMASSTRDLWWGRHCTALAGGGGSAQDQDRQSVTKETVTMEGSAATGGSKMALTTASHGERWRWMQGAISGVGSGGSGGRGETQLILCVTVW